MIKLNSSFYCFFGKLTTRPWASNRAPVFKFHIDKSTCLGVSRVIFRSLFHGPHITLTPRGRKNL